MAVLGLGPAGLATAVVVLALTLCVAYFMLKDKDPLASLSKPVAANGKPAIHVDTRAVDRAAEEPADRVLILYGTQTGTAERFAKSLRSQLETRYGASGKQFVALDVEGYPVQERLPKESLVLLLMATYGDGEPTDSAAEFHDWLVEKAEDGDDSDFLEARQWALDVTYGVFALGNRQYEHFCAVGQRLHGVMADLGARALLDPGLGDDDDDIDADFDGWTERLLAVLDADGCLGAAGAPGDGSAVSIEAYTVTPSSITVQLTEPLSPRARGKGTGAGDAFKARVLAARELHTAASDRSCVHVEVDMTGSSAVYEAGDHIAVLPRNSEEAVAAAAAALGVDLEFTFTLGPTASGMAPPFTGPTTLREALATVPDLQGPPSKAALAALAACAADETQAGRLRRMAAPEGKDDYHAYVVTPKRSLLEVLADFPSARPCLGSFFASVADALQPRYYSISSSPLAAPAAPSITCAVVDDSLPGGRGSRRGVASGYLATLRPGDSVNVFVRRSTFRLPQDRTRPVVMVGPGTGLAPFRGFLQERSELIKTGHGSNLGPATLFFGCRHEAADYIYGDELAQFVDNGALSQLHVAFSRDGPSKVYVQHLMTQAADDLWHALYQQKGSLYVCGDAKGMARDVSTTMVEIASTKLGSEPAGTAWFKALIAEGRIQRDIW